MPDGPTRPARSEAHLIHRTRREYVLGSYYEQIIESNSSKSMKVTVMMKYHSASLVCRRHFEGPAISSLTRHTGRSGYRAWCHSQQSSKHFRWLSQECRYSETGLRTAERWSGRGSIQCHSQLRWAAQQYSLFKPGFSCQFLIFSPAVPTRVASLNSKLGKRLTVWRSKKHRPALKWLILAVGSLLSLGSSQAEANRHEHFGKHIDRSLEDFGIMIGMLQVYNSQCPGQERTSEAR